MRIETELNRLERKKRKEDSNLDQFKTYIFRYHFLGTEEDLDKYLESIEKGEEDKKPVKYHRGEKELLKKGKELMPNKSEQVLKKIIWQEQEKIKNGNRSKENKKTKNKKRQKK